MKLNHLSFINVVESKHYINHHVDYINSVKLEDDNRKLTMYEERIRFFEENRWRRLILSSKTKKNLSNYTVPKEIRYNVLRSLPNRMDSILIDNVTLLRYIKTDTHILGMFDTKGIGEGLPINNYYFRFDLVEERATLSVGNPEDMNDPTKIDKTMGVFLEKFFGLFMVVVTYLELTPTILHIVDGGRSFGTKRDFKVKNETNKRFIIVNSNWNEEKINLRDIHVRGHWRLQPYGAGRTQYKYIFIQPFEKGIIHRLAQKELV
tara:strand:+ start:63 stop:851 length:789 start_codon:yes stop_codon:yes gene_type:complete